MTLLDKIKAELAEYYAALEADTTVVPQLLRDVCEAKKDSSACLQKSAMHAKIAEVSDEISAMKVFRYFPFFAELTGSRHRFDWGASSVWGGQLFSINYGKLMQPYQAEIAKFCDDALFLGWSPVGHDHHCPGYDGILEHGVSHVIDTAQQYLAAEKNQAKRDFYTAVIESNNAMLTIADSFAEKAKHLLETEANLGAKSDSDVVKNLTLIADNASRVPKFAPQTFYEALACIYFIREIYGTLEGYGMSTFGHLDRLLIKFYEADLASGRITYEEAKSFIHCLLAYTEIRFDMDNRMSETSTTIVIGGCDADGNAVYNAVTDMIAEAIVEGRYIGTKLLARVSSLHTDAYFDKISEILTAELPVLVFQNDDTIIAAHAKYGKASEDCRLYVGGGCHETVLANTEVNTRADSWLNMPRLLLNTTEKAPNCTSFDEFYSEFISDAKQFHIDIETLKNKYELMWSDCNPAPLYSSSITDCLKNGRDVSAGGAKYNSTTLSMLGCATLADSLMAIKAIVFDEAQMTLAEFAKILSSDYENNERLRQYIINKLPKYGTGDAAADAFSAKLMSDLAQISGRPNARNGKYYPAFYPHDMFITLGVRTPATPDGRKANTPISKGVSPSEFVKFDSPLSTFRSLAALDLTLFPESSATDLTIPPIRSTAPLTSLLRIFISSGGSTLQINTINPATLKAALANPENHKNLIVRVCGYSEKFHLLPRHIRNEVAKRNARGIF